MRVDFYSDVIDPLVYTYRLVRKAFFQHYQVVVLHQSSEQLDAFNALLWHHEPTDFLPHAVCGRDEATLLASTPIWLTLSTNEITPHAQQSVLVNLSESMPDHFDRYTRIVEIVSSEPHVLESARKRYRLYQQQGCTLSHVTT